MSAQRSSQNKLAERFSKNILISPANRISSGAGTDPSRSSTTPRNSTADETIAADKETLYATVRQIGNTIRPTTPLRRDSGAEPPFSRRSARRTPLGDDRTPIGPLQHASIRRSNIVTPHGRAAARGVELRRANMLTPGNDRRRNGIQQQRQTPREPLRALSRILAAGTQPIEPSPQPRSPFAGKVLVTGRGDDMEIAQETRPTLSMPLDDDEDDSLLLPPLRSTGEAEDENLTQRSIEFPRRAPVMEYSGLSRGSFGSIRTSDRLEEFNEMGLDGVAGYREDSSLIPQGDFEDYELESLRRDTIDIPEHQYIEDETRRMSLVFGRTQSIPEDETETTFILSVPQHDSLLNRQSQEPLNSSSERGGDDDEIGEVEEIEDFGYSGINPVRLTENSRRGSNRIQSNPTRAGRRKGKKTKKRMRVSKHGIPYPSLPAGVVKRLATNFLRASGKSSVKLSRDTLEAITLASDWFLEQASDDLGEYAQHGGRKTIDESDAFVLMKRQRQTSDMTTPFALAQKYLPRELLQDIRMTRHSKSKRAHQLEIAQEEFDED